mmetsp:Transcript_36229/g.52944  ORF Transcript_36229/g.52944 Transcript_36229/m.52944 type:complete len:140 (+) Transcript_36229:1269-1688(+)
MAFVPWQRHVIHVLQTGVCVLLYVEMDIVMVLRERIATTVPRIVVLAAEMEVVIQNTEKLVHRVQLTVELVLLRMMTCATHKTQRTVWIVFGETNCANCGDTVWMKEGSCNGLGNWEACTNDQGSCCGSLACQGDSTSP